MSRPRNHFPQPRKHKGRAVIDLWEGSTRRTVTLGRWGSTEAKQEHARILAEAATGGNAFRAEHTINTIAAAFLRWADAYYLRADGTKTHEVVEYEIVIRELRTLYGHTPAAEFGPLGLKAVRQKMLDRGWCRTLINRRVGRIRRVFKWAAAEELVPFETFQRLTAVEGIRRGRGARESTPVRPVDEAHAKAILPNVSDQVAAMIQVQLFTGCRPEEVCRLRPADVDRSGAVWVYRPEQHKNAHRGKPRAIAIGPRAQAVLARHWPDDPEAFCFRPVVAIERFHAERSEKRVTPLYPSHVRHNAARRTGKKPRPPAARYSTASYGRAIARGIERLNAMLIESAAEVELHVPHWTPNQLRHAAATSVRKRYGLEGAGAALGHDQLSTTEIYAEKNMELAARIALEQG